MATYWMCAHPWKKKWWLLQGCMRPLFCCASSLLLGNRGRRRYGATLIKNHIIKNHFYQRPHHISHWRGQDQTRLGAENKKVRVVFLWRGVVVFLWRGVVVFLWGGVVVFLWRGVVVFLWRGVVVFLWGGVVVFLRWKWNWVSQMKAESVSEMKWVFWWNCV